VSDLHQNLNTALAAVEPGPAPVEAAMLSGRKLRSRRRAGLLAGAVAVVVAAVVGVPAFTHHAALPAPTTSRIRITVNPPGPHSPAGLIASGLIGNARWSLSVESPTSGNCVFTGTGLSSFSGDCDRGQPAAAEPVSFEGASGVADSRADYVAFGQAWPGLVAARVELSDGTALTLRPAVVDGSRFVAFAVPPSVAVDSVTAYSRGGEIAVAIPFTGPSRSPVFSAWLRPGQAQPPRLTGTFGTGTANRRPWRATAYLGPWGACIGVSGQLACFDPMRRPATDVVGLASSWVDGTAADSVSYLVITPKAGDPVRVPATAVGGQKFWGVVLSQRARSGARWTAYDAAGRPVSSGALP
jgi:hypothetical protein